MLHGVTYTCVIKICKNSEINCLWYLRVTVEATGINVPPVDDLALIKYFWVAQWRTILGRAGTVSAIWLVSVCQGQRSLLLLGYKGRNAITL